MELLIYVAVLVIVNGRHQRIFLAINKGRGQVSAGRKSTKTSVLP